MKTLFLLLALIGNGSMDSVHNAILTLSGASCLEELDESEVERYLRHHEHPLDINNSSRSKLLSSGLFSSFQVQELLRYRQEYGDLLSYTELGMISAFSRDQAEALKAFTVLRSAEAPGQRSWTGIGGEVMARASQKGYGFKAGLNYGTRAELNWASRADYGSSFGPGTISAAVYGKSIPGMLVLGNFAARFGQGLTQWSGFSISSLNSVAAFSKNGGGIASTSSFTSELLGIGGNICLKGFCFSAACSFRDGISGIGNISWTGRTLSAGITANSSAVGADIRLGLKDISIFSEVSLNWLGKAAAVAGFIWVPSYGNRLALQGRWFDPEFKKDWSGVAACFQNSLFCISADAAWHYARSLARYKASFRHTPTLAFGNLSLKPEIMASSRWFPTEEHGLRNELRAELEAALANWQLNCRYDRVWCMDSSWLWYVEPGYRNDSAGLWTRFTLFKIDRWDDRIYVYERDAPQSFNVPAYYGRGWALSLVGFVKFREHALYLRIAGTRQLGDRDNKFEAKLQYGLRF